MNLGLLVLHVVLGGIVAPHGAQKLLGWFGGSGLAGTTGFFGRDFRAPRAMALLAGGTELFGGLALVLGFLTPFAALGFVVVMLNAIAVVHGKNGFFNAKGGFEFNLALWTVAVAVAATGPGRFSLDRLLGWDDNLSGLWWGVGVLGASLLGGLLVLALRKRPPEAATA